MTIAVTAPHLLRLLLALCLCAFSGYELLALWAARRWRKDQRPVDPAWTPPVTILKPVRGVDPEAYENFASFCRQNYPSNRIQYLFGALDPDDPALLVVERLQQEFPHLDIGIVTGGAQDVAGPNLKVCNLAAMLPTVKNDLLILCDGDMRARPDYVRRVVAPFQPDHSLAVAGVVGRRFPTSVRQKPVGLVTCAYRGCKVRSTAAALEVFGIGADFVPSALVSRALEEVGFAFGSTIAMPRAVLDSIGGFAPIASEIADDFRLGEGVRRAGYRVIISDYVVDYVIGKETLRAMWTRRLRWCCTVRSCRPAGYAGSAITHGVALALLYAAATGFSVTGIGVLGAVLAARATIAVWIARRYTDDPNIVRYLPLMPVSDVLSFVLFLGGLCTRNITWRGERFRLLSNGKIEPLGPPGEGDAEGPVATRR